MADLDLTRDSRITGTYFQTSTGWHPIQATTGLSFCGLTPTNVDKDQKFFDCEQCESLAVALVIREMCGPSAWERLADMLDGTADFDPED